MSANTDKIKLADSSGTEDGSVEATTTKTKKKGSKFNI